MTPSHRLSHIRSSGRIAPGCGADLIVCDAPIGSVAKDTLDALKAGDIPGITLVMIDGVVRVLRSRNTAPAARAAALVKGMVGAADPGH